MDTQMVLNHRYAVIGWGVLFIWWGLVVLIDPLTIGMGAIGTGLIFLGVNGIRLLKGIEPVESSTWMGLTALLWGLLDQGRVMLAMPAGVSFALLMVVIGVMVGFYPVMRRVRVE